jgi:hypothetical protein
MAADGSRRGGARAGAGRKAAKLDADLLERIGPAPLKAFDQARWYTNAIAILTEAVMHGRGPRARKMLQMIRESSAAAARVLPHDIIFEAARLLNQDEAALKASGSGAIAVSRKGDDVAQRARPLRRDPQ